MVCGGWRRGVESTLDGAVMTLFRMASLMGGYAFSGQPTLLGKEKEGSRASWVQDGTVFSKHLLRGGYTPVWLVAQRFGSVDSVCIGIDMCRTRTRSVLLTHPFMAFIWAQHRERSLLSSIVLLPSQFRALRRHRSERGMIEVGNSHRCSQGIGRCTTTNQQEPLQLKAKLVQNVTPLSPALQAQPHHDGDQRMLELVGGGFLCSLLSLH